MITMPPRPIPLYILMMIECFRAIMRHAFANYRILIMITTREIFSLFTRGSKMTLAATRVAWPPDVAEFTSCLFQRFSPQKCLRAIAYVACASPPYFDGAYEAAVDQPPQRCSSATLRCRPSRFSHQTSTFLAV